MKQPAREKNSAAVCARVFAARFAAAVRWVKLEHAQKFLERPRVRDEKNAREHSPQRSEQENLAMQAQLVRAGSWFRK
jgi:hypothetical protein